MSCLEVNTCFLLNMVVGGKMPLGSLMIFGEIYALRLLTGRLDRTGLGRSRERHGNFNSVEFFQFR